MKIKREQIIKQLKETFKLNDHVFAFWLEGADSLNTVDKYSDIDIWFDVEDGYESKVMKLIHNSLNKLGDLDLVQDYNHPHPKIIQHYFHIKNSSKFLLLDICIQSHSRKFSFIKEMTHEAPLVIFDKKGVIKSKPLNKIQFNKEIKSKIEELRLDISQYARATKYVHRKQFLEAMVYFHKWIMAPLVELLRIRYMPLTHDMHLVHISSHLPKKVIAKLEELYKIQNLNDIETNTKKALKMFDITYKYIEKVKNK